MKSVSVQTNLTAILSEAVSDDKELKVRFGEAKLLPYAGNDARTNHAYAKLLTLLSSVSPSRAAAHNDIIDYSFAGDLDVVRRGPTGFVVDGDSSEVNAPDKTRYAEWLTSLELDGREITKITRDAWRFYLTHGWVTILVDYSTVAGQHAVEMKVAGVSHALLTASRDKVIYFPRGVENLKQSAEHYVYPIDAEIGSPRSAFTFSNGPGPYGRPSDNAALRYMLIEALYASLDERIAGTERAATYVVFLPDNPITTINQPKGEGGLVDADEVEGNVESVAKEIKKSLTKGSIAVAGYTGDREPTMVAMEANRDDKYRRLMIDTCRSEINAANRWSAELTGASEGKGGLGSNRFETLVKFKDAVVIQGTQNAAEGFVNEVINWIALTTDNEWALDVRHKFMSSLANIDLGTATQDPITAQIVE